MKNKDNKEMSVLVEKAAKSIEAITLTEEQRDKKLEKIKNLQVVEMEDEELSLEEEKVNLIIDKMFNLPLENEETQEGVLIGLKGINNEVMQKAKNFTSQKLDARIGLLKGTDDGNEVFVGMIGLNDELKRIHPSNYDMTENTITKILPFLSPVRRYFKEFESTKSIIDSMKLKLETSIEEQRLDIEILKMDKRGLVSIAKEVKKAIAFNKCLLEKIKEKVLSEDRVDVIQFIESQIQFNITREIQGLQELLTVNIQGQQSFEMLIRTGTDLIDSAERCINVSVNAITIAAVIAHVVANQKRMLEGITAVNKTAETIIEANARMISETMSGVAKDAVKTNLNVDVLVDAITLSVNAIQDDIQFRIDSLPLMAGNIERLYEATQKAEASVKDLERSREIKENYSKEAENLFKI